MNKLYEWLFSYYCKRHPLAPAQFKGYADVQKVLILFESDMVERNDDIKKIIRTLQADGKQVTAWGYIHKKLPETATLRDYRVLADKDVRFWLCPDEQQSADICREHFDVLIDLTMEHSLVLGYLYRMAEVGFRVSRYREGNLAADFMIDLPTEKLADRTYLFEQVQYYLKNIITAKK